MGVPRLGRWIMERYPYAVRTVNANQCKNVIQNLYIDFNGMVHESLVRNSYVPLPTSEWQLFQHITNYLTNVVLKASPTRMVYIAIDGSSPDAKIRQQRLRRVFGGVVSDSQKEFRQNIAQYQDFYENIINTYKSEIPDNSIKDVSSASITPGTCFMSRLQSLLIIYLANVVEQDLWGNVEIVLSGCGVPGEGEHKIVSEIKRQQAVAKKLQQEDTIMSQQKYKQSSSSMIGQQFKRANQFKLDDNPINIEDLLGQPNQDQNSIQQIIRLQEVQMQQTEQIFELVENNVEDIIDQTMCLQSHCVFGMDGDLILLLLAMNQPEVYCLRRWQGIMVNDVEIPLQSKQDPWSVGLVILDISAIRESLLHEMLQQWFEDDQKFIELAHFVAPSQSQFLNDFIPESIVNLSSVKMPPVYYQQIREIIIYSEVADRVIHDFITLTLIVGNDFVPEVPGQSIRNQALDILIGYYRETFCSQLPLSFLIDENKDLNLKYISKMFKLIGDECEPIQIKNDIQNLINLRNALKKDSFKHDSLGLWQEQCDLEFQEMEVSLGNNLIFDFIKQRKFDSQKTKKIREFYQTKYYQKFDQLKLTNYIQPPKGITKNIQKKLALLDHYCNQCEQGLVIPNKFKQFVEHDVEINYYKGLHNLIRSYLKTIQWVIKYYLHPQGVPSWNWEYPYPFTPLCSDMAVYCQLYENDGGDWNTVVTSQVLSQQKLKNAPIETRDVSQVLQQTKLNQFQLKDQPIVVEDRVYSSQEIIELFDDTQFSEEEKLIFSNLMNYQGPKFNFILGQPKSLSMQIIFTLSKNNYRTFLPQHIVKQIPEEFFLNQPNWDNVQIVDSESAFKSFNLQLNMKRHNTDFLKFHNLMKIDFGWNTNFSSFYKNYPLGLTDGVHFESLMEFFDRAVYSQEETQFNESLYQRGCNMVFCKQQGSQSMFSENVTILAGPGSIIEQNPTKSKFDLDYKDQQIYPIIYALTKYRSKLQSCFILMKNSPECQSNDLLQQLYVSFSNTSSKYSIQISQQLSLPIYRGLHVYKENVSGISDQRSMKINVVGIQLKGNVQQLMFQNTSLIRESELSINSRFNNQYLQEKTDLFLREYQLLKSKTQISKTIEKVSQQSGIPIQYILNCPIISYHNNKFGVTIGFVHEELIYIRNLNEHNVLGDYIDQTATLNTIASKHSRSNKSAFSFLQNFVDQFFTFNQGSYQPDNQGFLLIAPLKYIQNDVLTIDFNVNNLESWFYQFVTMIPNKENTYYRDSLVPFENYYINCVPNSYIDKPYARQQSIRLLIENFAYIFNGVSDLLMQVEKTDYVFQVNTIQKIQFDTIELRKVLLDYVDLRLHIVSKQFISNLLLAKLSPKITEQCSLQLQKFEISQESKQSLIYQNSTPSIDLLNNVFKQYGNIVIDNQLLKLLEGSIFVTGSDGATRDFGLNVRNGVDYNPHYFYKNQPNGNFLSAVLLYAASMPYIFVPLVKFLKGKRFESIKAEEFLSFHHQEQAFLGQSISKLPSFHEGGFPIFHFESLGVFISNVQMDSILTISSLYLHSYIVPLVNQILINQNSEHLPHFLMTELSRYLRSQQLIFQKVDDAKYFKSLVQPNKLVLTIGDKVFVKLIQQLGIVISVGADTLSQARIMISHQGEKVNRSYKEFNIFQTLKGVALEDQLLKLPDQDIQFFTKPCFGFKLPSLNFKKLILSDDYQRLCEVDTIDIEV